MMLRFLLVVAAFCLALDGASASGCEILQRMKVKQQWASVYDSSEDREQFNLEIWEHIFHDHPDWPEKFFSRVDGNNTISPAFRAHAARISDGFDMSINLLIFPDVLDEELAHLGEQHKRYGNIEPDYFNTFRNALMDVVHDHIGRCFDKNAWDTCSKIIADGISSNMA